MDVAFIEIPEEIAHIFGEQDNGTRVYRREGSEEENSIWFDAVCAVADKVISPGGVGMYAPVSRAAVHNRMKEGKLTAFCFYVKRRFQLARTPPGSERIPFHLHSRFRGQSMGRGN